MKKPNDPNLNYKQNLRQNFKHLPFKKCANCQNHTIYQAYYSEFLGFKKWCIACGLKDGATKEKPVDIDAEISRLKEEKAIAWMHMKVSRANLVRVHRLCESFENRYNKDKTEFESADIQLAEIDGRLHRLEEGDSSKKKPTSNISSMSTDELFDKMSPQQKAELLTKYEHLLTPEDPRGPVVMLSDDELENEYRKEEDEV